MEKDGLEKADTKRSRFSSRSRLFGGKVYALQTQIFGTTSEDEELSKPVPLHHPHPKPPSIRPDLWSFRDDTIHPPEDEDTPPSSPSPSPSPDSDSPSPSPSLVPTVIATRPPSPQPHPCIDQARELGIKVRDFAYENHGVPLAPTIPDVDQLKISYYLYCSTGLTPPSETIENLKLYDPEWFADAERRYETTPKAQPETSARPWRHATEPWRGVETVEPLLQKPVAEEELFVSKISKITSWLETISLQNDSSAEKNTHP